MKKIRIAIFFLMAGFICSVLLLSCNNVINDTGKPAFKVYETIPADETTNVSPGTVTSISFSAEIDATTATTDTVVLADSKGKSVPGKVFVNGITATFAPGTVSTDASGEETFTPTELASPDTYSLTITTQLKDIYGRSLPRNYTISFSTGTDSTTKAAGTEGLQEDLLSTQGEPDSQK
jgi:hypothetical protein